MKTMQPLPNEVRNEAIKSFRKAVNDKKEIRVSLIEDIKNEKSTKESLSKLRPVTANAHLLALILRDLTYKRMLRSYSDKKHFWKQLSSLYRARFEHNHALDMISVQKQMSSGRKDIVSLPSTELYDLVKLFNNEVYDPGVAFYLSVQIERAFANCKTEMIAGDKFRDGFIPEDSEYI